MAQPGSNHTCSQPHNEQNMLHKGFALLKQAEGNSLLKKPLFPIGNFYCAASSQFDNLKADKQGRLILKAYRL